MLYFIFALILMNAFSTTVDSNRPSSLKNQRKKTFAALVFSNNNNHPPSDKKSCQWLSRLKHQHKICWKRRGLPETLLNARNLSITQCQNQFEFERWNCSKRESYFKKVYRETAFMYSIASSAVMFSVVKACSDGTLIGCKCGDRGKVQNATDFKWEGCNDNLKFAKRFTKKFLQLKKKGDGVNAINRYNAEMGIKVVLQNEERVCKCHGVSGSCGVKVCVMKIRPFDVISKQLKTLYHSAIHVKPGNTIGSFKSGKKAQNLLYLEESTNLCNSTAGRRCKTKENCDTLCCGNGFYTTTIKVRNNTCDCSFRKEQFDVKCKSCTQEKVILICK